MFVYLNCYFFEVQLENKIVCVKGEEQCFDIFILYERSGLSKVISGNSSFSNTDLFNSALKCSFNDAIAVVLWFQAHSFGFKVMGDIWHLLRCEVLWKEIRFHGRKYLILLAPQKEWDSPFFHYCFPQENTMAFQEFWERMHVLSTHSNWKPSFYWGDQGEAS